MSDARLRTSVSAWSRRALSSGDGLVIRRDALRKIEGLKTHRCALCGDETSSTKTTVTLWRVPTWIGLAAVFAYGLVYRFAVHTLWGTWDTFLLLGDYTVDTVPFLALPFVFPFVYLGLFSLLGALAFGYVKLHFSTCEPCAHRQRRGRRMARGIRLGAFALAVTALLLFPAVSLPVPLVGLWFIPFVFIERFTLARLFPHVVRLGRSGTAAVEVEVPPATARVLSDEHPDAILEHYPEDERRSQILRAVAPTLVLLQVVQLTVRNDYLQDASAFGAIPVHYVDGWVRMRGGLLPSARRHGEFEGYAYDRPVKVREERWNHGRQHGPYREWYPSGRERIRGSYWLGLPSGPSTFFDEGGRWKETLVDGSAGLGDWQDVVVEGSAPLKCPPGTRFVGKLAGARGCLDDNDRLQGILLQLTYNGGLMAASMMKDGRRDGVEASLTDRGTVRDVRQYREDQLDGETFYFTTERPIRVMSVERYEVGKGRVGVTSFVGGSTQNENADGDTEDAALARARAAIAPLRGFITLE